MKGGHSNSILNKSNIEQRSPEEEAMYNSVEKVDNEYDAKVEA